MVVRSRIRRHPAGVVLGVPVAASVRLVASGTVRCSRPVGIGLAVAESESSLAGGIRAGDKRDRGRGVARVGLGDLRERRLVDRPVRLGVAGVGWMVEKLRTIGEDHRLGDRLGVVDSCLVVDVGRRWPEEKCKLVVEEVLPGHRRGHIRLK